jgi:FMN-dependent dehydrogenase
MSAADARAARDAGADAIFISNHGGRQFDAQPSTTHALQEIAAAVGGQTEILIDGGIRHGSDILKLTALGASACLVGRPAVYGAVTAGQPGVSAILRTLAEEAATALAFTGATRLDDLNPDMVAGATAWRSAGPLRYPLHWRASTHPVPAALGLLRALIGRQPRPLHPRLARRAHPLAGTPRPAPAPLTGTLTHLADQRNATDGGWWQLPYRRALNSQSSAELRILGMN